MRAHSGVPREPVAIEAAEVTFVLSLPLISIPLLPPQPEKSAGKFAGSVISVSSSVFE